MVRAIEQGLPKLRIEEAAARTQARIDSGEQAIVGVNRYRPEESDEVDVLGRGQRRSATAPDRSPRAAAKERDAAAVDAALERLTDCAGGGAGNLLELAVEAARAHATVGEISAALEAVWGRHEAVVRSISGVYSGAMGESSASRRSRAGAGRAVRRASTAGGRASSSPRWARTATTGARRSSPPRSPTSASTSTSGRSSRPPRRRRARPSRTTCTSSASPRSPPATSRSCRTLKAALVEHGRDDIMVVVGGVIPARDHQALQEAGATAIFGPGTVIADAAIELLDHW